MLITPSTKLEFSYPNSTNIGTTQTYQKREIQIQFVRDLVNEPLTPIEFFNRPMLMRSRFLISAMDLGLNKPRQFYMGNSLEYETDGSLLIGIYANQGQPPIDIVDLEFGPTKRERIVLANVLRRWLSADLDGLWLGVFAHDFSVFSD